MHRIRAFSLALCLFFTASLALAQMPGRPGEMPGREHGGDRGPGQGMGILPPGTFWRNPETVKLLTLTPDQQKQMESIFHDSRVQLIQLHASLEEEQLNLEPLLNAAPFDQSKALAEISKIAELRASLEKADAKMLISLRGVLTADQWTKFQTEMHRHRREEGRPGQDNGQEHGGWQGRSNRREPGGYGPPSGGPNNAPPPPPSGSNDITPPQ